MHNREAKKNINLVYNHDLLSKRQEFIELIVVTTSPGV